MGTISWKHSSCGRSKFSFGIICVCLCSSVAFPRLSRVRQPLAPGGDDFLENVLQAVRQLPLRVVRLHFAEVAVVTDVVAAAGLVHVGVSLLLAGAGFGHLKRFENGAGV